MFNLLAFFRSRFSVGVTWLILLSLLLAPAAGSDRKTSIARMLGDVQYLASDELQGRGVGTAGLDQAAQYIARAFADAGLNVTGVAGKPFQSFTMTTGTKLGSPNSLTLHGPENESISLTYDSDFRTCSFGNSGTFSGELVFLGYGIKSKEADFDEFQDVDVKDKIVIVMRRNPRQDLKNGPFASPRGGVSRHASLRSKLSLALNAGALAVLFVNDPYSTRQEAEDAVERARNSVIAAAEELIGLDHASVRTEAFQKARQKLADALERLKARRKPAQRGGIDTLMKFGYGGTAGNRTLPVLHISQKVCNRLLKSSLNTTLDQMEAAIDRDLKPRSAALEGWSVEGTASLIRTQSEVKNVVGVLEGTGATADETIVVGAHYDHLGMGGAGSLARGSEAVHNGADDNASGTAGVIELARRLASRPEPLPRRVVFVAFTAEERGLIGSARYVKEPVVPLDKTIAMFNLDMIGRLRENKLTVFGSGTAKRWKNMLESDAPQHQLKLTLKPSGFGPSDQSSFYAKKIPVLHFFTGTHGDYHRPSDDWDKLNTDGMNRIVDLMEELIVATAQASERPEYVAVPRAKSQRRTGDRPYVGSIPDFASEGPGYAISGVAPKSPAERAGLKGGDRIVEFGGFKINDLEDFDLALRRFSAGDRVDVTVQRNGETLKLHVSLEKPR